MIGPKEDRFCKKVATILMACHRNKNIQMEALQISQDILIASQYLSEDEAKAQKKLDELLNFIEGI